MEFAPKVCPISTALKIFYHAHIQPHIDFASTVWDGASEAHLKPLNSLHRRAIKRVSDKNPEISTDDKFKQLGILPLQKQLLFNKAVLMRKITLSATPSYLTSMFRTTHTNSRTPRDSLVMPRPRRDIFMMSLSYSGAKVFNSLQEPVRTAQTINAFKARLQKHLLS